MGIRVVERELESRLEARGAEGAPRASGKIERKTYSDGSERLKIVLRGLEAFEGSTAVVTNGSHLLAEIEISGGKGRSDQRSPLPGVVPIVFEESPVEVRVGDLVLAQGRVERD